MAKKETFADIDKLFESMSKECANSKAWDMSPRNKKSSTTKRTSSKSKGKK